jgi:hypothetical protein
LVSCAILDDADDFLAPRGPGVVAVVHTATHEIVDTAELTHQGPLNFMAPYRFGGAFVEALVATVPNYTDLTEGCVELVRVDSSDGTVTANGCEFENAVLGGYMSAMIMSGDTLWATVVDAFDELDYGALGSVVSVGPDSVVNEHTGDDVRAFSLAVCPHGQIVVGDAGGGLRVFDDAMTELSSALLDIGAPPVEGGIVCY